MNQIKLRYAIVVALIVVYTPLAAHARAARIERQC